VYRGKNLATDQIYGPWDKCFDNLQEEQKKLWTRSQFGTLSKVDYVTDNLAGSFNNWIKEEKGKHLDDLMDTIRQKLLIKWNHRKKCQCGMWSRH
jgi:hypothetical protein